MQIDPRRLAAYLGKLTPSQGGHYMRGLLACYVGGERDKGKLHAFAASQVPPSGQKAKPKAKPDDVADVYRTYCAARRQWQEREGKPRTDVALLPAARQLIGECIDSYSKAGEDGVRAAKLVAVGCFLSSWHTSNGNVGLDAAFRRSNWQKFHDLAAERSAVERGQ